MSLSHSAAETAQADTIIALERAALDRWGKGEPQGYLETYAPEITYFDPMGAKRIDGYAAMQEYYRPITGTIRVDSYDMIGAKVQQHGDVAVLSYNLVSHARKPTGEPLQVRWNSTAVYVRGGGTWKIIHSHFSFTQPAVTIR
jgi:ketosteroid isomerase-like protein